MPKLLRTYTVVVALITLLAINVLSGQVVADEKPDSDAGKSPTEFRVDVPVRADDNRSAKEMMKSKLLTEKLIKMGRARSQGCTRCHGRSGIKALAKSSAWQGSIAEFVVTQLAAFREGRRSHIVMSSIAEAMSDQDIALVATWYQSVSNPTASD